MLSDALKYIALYVLVARELAGSIIDGAACLIAIVVFSVRLPNFNTPNRWHVEYLAT